VQCIRSPALAVRLHSSESALERLRASTKVIDVQAIIAAIPRALARYRTRRLSEERSRPVPRRSAGLSAK
jgi:hypothetical protein